MFPLEAALKSRPAISAEDRFANSSMVTSGSTPVSSDRSSSHRPSTGSAAGMASCLTGAIGSIGAAAFSESVASAYDTSGWENDSLAAFTLESAVSGRS